MIRAEELLRAYLLAGDNDDEVELRRVLDPDVVTYSPGGQTLRGVDEALRSWKAAHRGLDELRHDIEAVVGSAQSVAGRVRVSGVHNGSFLGVPPTGRHIEVDQALFLRAERSTIVELWEIVDTGSGLRQLGLLPGQALAPGEHRSAPDGL